MLHTEYQDSMTFGFRQEDFSMFSLYKPKHMNPQGGAMPFWPRWHNFNKLGIDPLDDATNQIPRL